jgi:hypothetical protein
MQQPHQERTDIFDPFLTLRDDGLDIFNDNTFLLHEADVSEEPFSTIHEAHHLTEHGLLGSDISTADDREGNRSRASDGFGAEAYGRQYLPAKRTHATAHQQKNDTFEPADEHARRVRRATPPVGPAHGSAEDHATARALAEEERRLHEVRRLFRSLLLVLSPPPPKPTTTPTPMLVVLLLLLLYLLRPFAHASAGILHAHQCSARHSLVSPRMCA